MSMLKPHNKAEVEFTFVKEIGHEGKNSTCFIADDKQLDAQIVVKKIAKADLDVDKYFDESRILYLSAHPNVVQVLYACQDSDHIFIAMPFYKSGSLGAQLNSRNLSVREIVGLGCNVASALHHIHSKKLIHFDVKPDNILLSDRGEGLLSDFGLAARTSVNGTAEQDRLYYKMRPPESFGSGIAFGPEFDIYQFGLTLYRMANGNAEFNKQFSAFGADPMTFDRDGFKFAVRNGKFPERDVFPSHIPARLRKVIKKCIETDIAARFSSVMEIANELSQIEDRLDWVYTMMPGERRWDRKVDGKAYSLSVKDDGSSYAQKGQVGGKLSRVTAYCKASITDAEIQRFLRES